MPRSIDAELNRTLGRNLVRLRDRNGLGQRDLAPLLGISAAQISKYENGENQVSIRTLWLLAKAPRAELGDFFLGYEPDLPGGLTESPQAEYGMLEPEEVRRELAKLLPDMDDDTAARVLKIARTLIAHELEAANKS